MGVKLGLSHLVKKSLKAFKNRVLRTIPRAKRAEVTGDWRKQHNEELCDLYSSPNIIQVIKWRRMRWVGHVVCVGGEKKCIQGLGGETQKRLHGNLRHRWEDNINMSVTEVGWKDMHWINPAQDMGKWWVVVSTVMNHKFDKMKEIS
jgi:hypothetical protein